MNQDQFYNDVEGESFFLRSLSDFSADDVTLHKCLRENKQSILDFIEARVPLEGITVLEVGCAVGDLLFILRENYGCQVSGVEPSSSATKVAREALGLDISLGTFRQTEHFTIDDRARHQFDLVILDDVVGWMGPDLLLPTLGALDWALRPGGSIFIRELYSTFPYRVKNRHHPGESVYQYRYPFGVGNFFLNTGTYFIAEAREYSSDQFQKIETNPARQIWRDSVLLKTEENLFPIVEV